MIENKKKPNPIDIHVGSRIRLRRTMLGMSQEKLGESLGLTFQQVQKYEKGSNRIGASRLYQIGAVLGVPIEFFFEGLERGQAADGADHGARFDTELLSSAEGIQLNSAFFSISDPRLRKRLLDLVKAMAGDPGEADAE